MDSSITSESGLRKSHVVILMLLLFFSLLVVGVTGYFRLGSDSAALCSSVMRSSTGQWHKKIALHVGGLTMGVVRTSLRWVKLPEEPRAALEAVRAAEVGIYKLQNGLALVNPERLVAAADKTMVARGWDRALGVIKERDLVLAYVPHRGVSVDSMKCCLVVLHEDFLVVGSTKGNLQPLIEIAKERLDLCVPKVAIGALE